MKYQFLKQILTTMGLNHSYLLSVLPFSILRPVISSYYGNIWNELPSDIKALFIHIPKNAGTSVSGVLYGMEMGHRPAVLYQATNAKRFNELPSFAIIRNPYDRFCSIFNHNKCQRYKRKIDLYEESLYSRFSGPGEFARAMGDDDRLKNNFMSHILARPQAEWIKIENKIAVNYLFTYENLHSLQNFLDDLAGSESLQLPHTNASGRKQSWQSELDERAKNTIYNLYKEDFELWERLQTGMTGFEPFSQYSGAVEQKKVS